MQIKNNGGAVDHLTYCSNIHPGESWDEVRQNIQQHVPSVRHAINAQSPFTGPFGIGLRLSASATDELSSPESLAQFKDYLDTSDLYVFTINGFPYGPFHGTRVKEDVYLPDWKDQERLRYTNQIADVFATLLPDNQTGTISTVPGAFKARVNSTSDIELMTRNMVSHVAHLVQIEREHGACIKLALEPEPCCYLETIDESVNFFTRYLYADTSVIQLANAVDVDHREAALLLRKHLTLCLDLCHAAVEFEDAGHCISALADAEVNIGKVQISAGLRLTNVTPETAKLLQPFDDGVYLHQVIEKHGNTINRYTDLPEAFAQLTDDNKPREWRVHFHVPIFLDDLGEFSSTRFFIEEMLAIHKNNPVCDHLEVETYTWSVLPERYKNQSIDDAIARELNWVRQELT